jgi:hypothetical protein
MSKLGDSVLVWIEVNQRVWALIVIVPLRPPTTITTTTSELWLGSHIMSIIEAHECGTAL